MSKLTKAEKEWIEKVQAVLNECPSQRLGFFTIGDSNISVFDKRKEGKINDAMDAGISGCGDFGPSVDKFNAYLGELIFPSGVYSTAG